MTIRSIAVAIVATVVGFLFVPTQEVVAQGNAVHVLVSNGMNSASSASSSARGDGDVYRALNSKLNRPVAVKFISDESAGAAGRRRFQREAQLASSLNDARVLTVYDIGEFEGRQYPVAEYVDGGSLKNWARPSLARESKHTWRNTVE